MNETNNNKKQMSMLYREWWTREAKVIWRTTVSIKWNKLTNVANWIERRKIIISRRRRKREKKSISAIQPNKYTHIICILFFRVSFQYSRCIMLYLCIHIFIFHIFIYFSLVVPISLVVCEFKRIFLMLNLISRT